MSARMLHTPAARERARRRDRTPWAYVAGLALVLAVLAWVGR